MDESDDDEEKLEQAPQILLENLLIQVKIYALNNFIGIRKKEGVLMGKIISLKKINIIRHI